MFSPYSEHVLEINEITLKTLSGIFRRLRNIKHCTTAQFRQCKDTNIKSLQIIPFCLNLKILIS